MRIGIFILLCFWFNWGFSQNFLEKTQKLVENFQQEQISQNDSLLLDSTARKYFYKDASDSVLISGINIISGRASTESVVDTFNAIMGELAKWKIAQPGNSYFFKRVLGTHYLNRASSFAIKGQLKEGLKFRYKAFELYNDIKDTAMMVETLIKLGIDHYNAKDYEQSEKWYRQSIHFMELRGDSLGVLRLQESIGAILAAKGEKEASLPYFQASLDLAIQEQNYPSIAQIQYLKGGVLSTLERFDDAEESLGEALEIFEMFGFDYGISLVEEKLAGVYIAQEKWPEALKHATRAFEIAQKVQLQQSIASISSKLYTIYKATSQYQKSLEMLELHTKLKDSLAGAENTKALLEQRLQYEYEQKAKLDSVQNAAVLSVQVEENKRRRNTSYYLLVGLVLTGIFAFILYNRFRITKRQRNQLDAANEQLKELDQSKSRFFTNISHEFRTPLTVISGMADMVNDSEPRELIKRNSQSLLGLVNQILDLRKLEAGKLPVHMSQGNVIPFLQYLLESFQSYAESKGIQLTFSTDTPEVIMDYDQKKLHSIITNLISNAIKFTPDGGMVRLEVSGSWFPVQNAGTSEANQDPETRNQLFITVTDSGIGIPSEKLNHIFDRFYQVDDSSTREGEGTGIGLTLTHELVKVLGGRITAESEEGKGTAFNLQLPITQKAPKEDAITSISESTGLATAVEEVEEIPAGSSDAFKLLIVEDNPDVVRYLQACLRDAYQISIAKDGQEGIEKAIAEVPDIIISDVMMPRKDGFELCQTLKTDERTSHIPIILLTAKADVESRISGLQRGADAYLAKPFEKAELMVRLEMLIKLRQQLQARYQDLDQPSPAENEATQIEDAFIQKLNDQIFENITDSSIDVQRLCEWTGMSRTQFHHKIKALTGRSASNYLRFVRLREAQKHLEISEKSIAEVAYEVGFNDPAYFSRSFVKEFGLAPSEIRK